MSVRLESNGTWTAQVWYRDYNNDSLHKTKRGLKTEDEAKNWEVEFSAEAVESVNSTFASFYEACSDDMQPRPREHTWHTKKYMIEGKFPCTSATCASTRSSPSMWSASRTS